MIIPFQDKTPHIAEGVFIAPTAVIIGDTILHSGANIWFGAVLRGDLNQIVIGSRSSIQDNSVIHVNRRKMTLVGEDVIVGHGAILEGCEIGNGCMIGMNATVLSGAVIGMQSIVAAGTLVREGQIIPPRVLVAGVPAEIKRELNEDQYSQVLRGIDSYQELMRHYSSGNP